MIERKEKTHRQNIEQERGKQAWDDIREVKKPSEETAKLLELEQDEKSKKKLEKLLNEFERLQKEYRSLARGLNAMIQVNGLGQTLGFLKAKGKIKVEDGIQKRNAHFYLLVHLTHWMHDHFDDTIADAIDSKNDGLLEWVTHTASSSDYRRATTECLAFGTWLRRFAEGELKDPEEVEGSQPQGGAS